MGLFRGDRFRLARSILAAALVYVMAATGLLGSFARAANGLDSTGFVVICTPDGSQSGHDDSQPPSKAGSGQHCALCHVTGSDAPAKASSDGVAVAPPSTSIPWPSYAAILPAYALAGWLGTRSPRAPPVGG